MVHDTLDMLARAFSQGHFSDRDVDETTVIIDKYRYRPTKNVQD